MCIRDRRVVVLLREERGAGIVTVLLDQRECFRQQLDASEVVSLLSPVFQPEAALVIPEEVLPGDAYRISIGENPFLSDFRSFQQMKFL